jgi:glycosyltransferase involved in cell wall biosynthesis
MAAVGLTRAGAWKLGYQFLAGAHLARRLLHWGSEHVHIHFAHVPTQIGMYAAAMAALPFTVMAHANDIFERQLLLRQKAARAKRFLTISEFNARYLREAQGLCADHVAVVRCGVSPTVAGACTRPATTPQVGPFRLGSLGRLVEKKGFDTLIAALGLLRDQGLHVQLEIAGDGPLQAELSQQTQALGLQQQVRFLGAVSHDQVQAWLCQLDCFVLACRQDAQGDMDGIPVALMEAMAVGLPVVSCRLSGVPELVVHGQTGLLAEPGNAADLAHQLHRFITEPSLCSSLAAAGARHVAHEFSQDLNIQRLLGHFAPSA